MNESDIQDFWNSHPCGDSMAGSLASFDQNYEAFFDNYDRFRYSLESHIPRCLDGIGVAERSVLEVGLGQGADAEQLIRRGARWTGVDLTQEAVDRVRKRMSIRGLPVTEIRQGSALALPFADATFDVVYSHGVLHHIPDINSAQREIRRVLRPDGKLVVMLYSKWSLNYLLSISVVRRIALLGLLVAGVRGSGKAAGHLRNARTMGVIEYLKMRNFIHRNTDGPSNPYAKVYDLELVKRDFPAFEIVRSHKEFMYAPPLPVRWLPLARFLGWHLWVHMVPKACNENAPLES